MGSGVPTCILFSSGNLWPLPGETSVFPHCFAASVCPRAHRVGPPGPGSHPQKRRKQMGVTKSSQCKWHAVIFPLELRSGHLGQARDPPFYRKYTVLGLQDLLTAWNVLLCPLYIPRDPARMGLLTGTRPSYLPGLALVTPSCGTSSSLSPVLPEIWCWIYPLHPLSCVKAAGVGANSCPVGTRWLPGMDAPYP